MKRLISFALILATLSLSAPAFARWVCLSTNASHNLMWYWHGPNFSIARDRALGACANSFATLNPATCHLVVCHPGIFAPGPYAAFGPGPVGFGVGVGF